MSLPWNIWERLSRCTEERDTLAARVAELEARTHEAEESNANALARLSAAEATIELRRIENEAVRHQVWHAENVCDAMQKRMAELEARCKRLEEAGDVLQSAVVGVEGMTHWQWLAAAHEADLKWRSAKEAKP